jgi:biotin carboxylase
VKKHVFVIGLDDFQRAELQTIRNPEKYEFHGLLDYQTVVQPQNYSFEGLLDQARRELDAFDAPITAIIAHWDFPTSVMAPILCAEHGIPSPSLEAVLKCEHKYWSRLEQSRVIPECIPAFHKFDPFDEHALEKIELDYPFWIKPVKSFASQLGFKISSAEQFHEAVARIRESIRDIGDAFDEVLARVELPEDVREATGSTCIAEQIIAGIQAAPEGSMFQGEYKVHGVLDMPKDAAGNSFSRYEYPSQFPPEVQQRMINATEKFLRHIGFDNGCFNSEFMWDQANDKLWLIEVNTRISQSHSDLFAKVDGMSNHEVAIDVAHGIRPSMPYRQGEFRVAAKCMIPHDHSDGIVKRIPSEADIQRLKERFPGTHVMIDVKPGTHLAQLRNQDSYRYVLGTLFIGADSHEQLVRKFDACIDALHFEFEPVEARSAGNG